MDLRRVALAVVAGAALHVAAAGAAFDPARAADEGSAPGEAFVAGFEDLPLMPGLTQIPDAGVAFDAPSGRIVEAYAEGRLGREEVAAFYARTLPQLGWQAVRGSEYRREGERLRLEISADEDPGPAPSVTVRFYLFPD